MSCNPEGVEHGIRPARGLSHRFRPFLSVVWSHRVRGQSTSDNREDLQREDLRGSRPARPSSSTPSRPRASTSPSPSRRPPSPTRSPAATCAARPGPARARRSRSGCRCSRPRRSRVPGHPTALVLVPTRELAKQVVDVLAPLGKEIGMRVAAFYGGTSLDKQVRNLQPPHRGRGRDARPHDRPARARRARPRRGRDARDRRSRPHGRHGLPAAGRVDPAQGARHDRQTLLFSATLDREVDVLVRRYMRDPVRHEVESDTKTVDDMTHRFLQRARAGPRQGARRDRRAASSRTMVFVRTKRGADRLVSQLKREGVVAGAIHGDLRQSAREKALKDFQARAATPCSSPPTSPPAASTSTTSTSSSTSTRPKSTRATCTARVAPPAPGARASS